MPKFTNTRDARRSAQEAQQAKASRDKLMIHASERVATRAIEMLEVAIESNRQVEMAIIEKLDGDQLLKREAQQFSFAERLYTDFKEVLMTLQMAQMGFSEVDSDSEDDWSDDLKAM